LCPEYEGLELGIGESLLLKAIAESTGREMKKIKADYAEIGDLGVIAMVCGCDAIVQGSGIHS
jgi:DNA ligase-1